MTNNVKGKLTLTDINKIDEVEDNHTTTIDVNSGLIVHHYIEGTTTPLAADETTSNVKVGTSYTTTKSTEVPKNYEAVSVTTNDNNANVNEENLETNGNIREEQTIVIYYYRLKEETVTNEITKTATTSKEITRQVEGGTEVVPILTNEDGVVTYNITYTTTIKDYIGKAKITLVDTLPAKINVEKSNLAGGTYNAETNTISWEERIPEVNTYECENETYTKTIEKELKVVYEGQDLEEDLVNTVKGTTITYYPDNDPSHPGEPKTTLEKEDTAKVEQQCRVTKTVEKVWEDSNNQRGNRPEKIMVELTANGVKLDTAELSNTNNWKHEFKNLDKYDENDNLIEYTITEKEIKEDDLEYYEEAVIVVNGDKTTITNTHRKLGSKIESTIEKDGTKELVGRETEVEYSIKYNAKVTDYIGEARVTIVDYLPYKIDKEKSNLDEGIYDEETKTITWSKDLGHINTIKNGDFTTEITKAIKVSYIDLDVKAEKMTNKAKGQIELLPTGEKEEVEDDHDTKMSLIGKIIVEYKDIDTNEDIPYIDENGEKKLYNYEEEGYVGDNYKTKEKEIPYYELVKVPENKEGQFQKEEQTVTYYYKKLPFNIGIDKTIKEVSINGETKWIANNKLTKLEIPESKLAKAEIIVKYKIVVKNTEKIDGKAEIVDNLPAGFVLASTNPTYWEKLQGGKIQTEVELKAGEQKELEVVLKWQNSNKNLGTLKNIVEVANTDNIPKYADNNAEDNISTAEVIISVKTGIEVVSDILIITGTLGLMMLFAVAVIDMKIGNRKK